MAEPLFARDILDCERCMAHYYSPACLNLPGACASVGIEFGKSTRQMILEYLAGYHERGHRER